MKDHYKRPLQVYNNVNQYINSESLQIYAFQEHLKGDSNLLKLN